MRTAGIILIIIGAIMMIYTGFNVITREEVADIGPLEITKEESHPVSWSPIIGVVLLVAGIVMTISARRKSMV